MTSVLQEAMRESEIMHKNSLSCDGSDNWSGYEPRILIKGGRKMVCYFPSLIKRKFRVDVLKCVVAYAREGYLKPNADHTHGEYVDVGPSKFWREEFPLRGCTYLSRSVHQIGHTNEPSYPSSSLAGGSKKFSFGINFLSEISPLSELANHLLKLVDSDFYDKLNHLRRRMMSSSPHVKAICSVDPSLHTNLGIIVNRRSGPHTDKSDMDGGWAVMFVFGNFDGGTLSLPGFGVTARYSSGDVYVLRAGEVEHMVNAWSGMIRVTLVYFTKQSVWKEYSQGL